MLYERWRNVALERKGEPAVWEGDTGRRWTFDELLRLGEKATGSSGWTYPRGRGLDFLVGVLRGWRAGKVVCPLEPEDTAPRALGVPEGCVHLKHTSATMGRARWIAFTEAQLAADAENIVSTMGLRPESPNLAVISLVHSYGFSNLVLPLLLKGIPLVLGGQPLPEAVRRLLQTYREVTVPAVPALWRVWCETGVLTSPPALAISAGAPLPLPVEETIWRRFGIKVHNFLGASECGGIGFDRSELPREQPALIGKPLDHVELRTGPDGCLVVQSAAVGLSYWPEAEPALAEGEYQTRDLVEIQDGQIYWRGRLGDQINVAGRKVTPESVERCMHEYPPVVDCLAFGVPSADTHHDEVVAACVVLEGEASEEGVRRFLLERLPAWQVPREWWLVSSLAPDARGKLSRVEWRQRFLAQRR